MDLKKNLQDIKKIKNVKNIKITEVFKKFFYLFSRFFVDDGPKNVAALTYTTLFAVVPFFTVLYSILSIIPAFQELNTYIQDFLFKNFVPATGEKIQDYLTVFTGQARKLTSVGIGFLVVTAIMMIINIEAAFNDIWRVKEGRKGLQAFLLYWAVITLGPLLLAAGFLVSSFLFSVPFFENDFVAGGKILVLQQLPLILSLITFTVLYWALPNCKVEFKHAFVGGLISAIVFELGKKAFTYFISNFASYELIYGAFAVVPIFLLWIYLTWWLILLGAELVATLGEMKGKDENLDKHPSLQIFLLLDFVWQSFVNGDSISENMIRRYIGNLDRAHWYKLREFLLAKNLILIDDSNNISAGKNYSLIKLADLILSMPWQLPEVELWDDRIKNKKIFALIEQIQQNTKTVANLSLDEALRN